MQTIGDVINAINRNTSGVHAAINSTGDGIVLTDTANGSGTLSVTEGDSTTAQDLHLLGAETTVNGAQTINGSTTRTITLKPGDTLTDLQNDINNLGGRPIGGDHHRQFQQPLSPLADRHPVRPGRQHDCRCLANRRHVARRKWRRARTPLLALGNASASNSAAPTPRSW